MNRLLQASLAVAAALLYVPSFTAQTASPPPPPGDVAFSTYFGGSSGQAAPRAVAVDAAGRVHVAGTTCSADEPTTADAIRTTPAGGCDGYLAILSPEGALLYATYLGGSFNEVINALALDASGNIYVAGHTGSRDFPTTAGAYDRTCGYDGACTSSRYAGAQYADAFVVKLTSMGKAVAFSTYLGGGDTDVAVSIAVDAAGRAHVGGHTDSLDFPWTPGALGRSFNPDPFTSPDFDGFYSRLSADGSALLYSTYISGSRPDFVTAVAADGSGAAYIGGYTESSDFATLRAMQPSASGSAEGFLVKIAASDTWEFSTYLGGAGRDQVSDVAVSGGVIYLTGETSSADFPVPGAAGGTYIARMPADGSTFARALMLPGLVRDGRLAVDQHERAYFVGTAGDNWTAATTPDAVQSQNAGHGDVAFAIFTMGTGQPDAPLYGTFFGGSGSDAPTDLALDPAGSAYLVGGTNSPDFPRVNAAAGGANGGGFIVRFTADGLPRRDVAGEVVLYARDLDDAAGAWRLERDPSAAGGARLFTPDVGGPKVTAPLASPADYVDFSFTADAGVPYHLWIRGRAAADHWANDSVWVQFSDSVDSRGSAVWRIGSSSGTSVNLEECVNCGVRGWGWQDNGYGAGVFGANVQFATSGTHTLRLQVREDGFSIDQIVLSSARFLSGAPGAAKGDSVVLGRSNSGDAPVPPDEPPPSTCDAREIVIHPGAGAAVAGAWVIEADPSAASGRRVRHPDAGAAKLTAALAFPSNYFEVTFEAEAGVAYRLWMRARAQNDYWGNDSVFAQFDGSVDASGQPVWRLDTTSAARVNLEDCSSCGLRGWGWQDNGYGAGVLGPIVRFATSGTQRLRVQTREDGVAIDQIVLSASRFVTAAPGPLRNDATTLPACSAGTAHAAMQEIVLYTADQLSGRGGDWTRVPDPSAAGGAYMLDPDRGAPKVTRPIAVTEDVLQLQFVPQPGVPYRLWLRLRATSDHWANDSVWVQFSGSLDSGGNPIFRIGTTSGTSVNLEECSGCRLSGWGWQDNGWGAGVLGPEIYFDDSGVQTIRIQPREDGVAIDQVVLSAGHYRTQAPGQAKNDTTELPR